MRMEDAAAALEALRRRVKGGSVEVFQDAQFHWHVRFVRTGRRMDLERWAVEWGASLYKPRRPRTPKCTEHDENE